MKSDILIIFAGFQSLQVYSLHLSIWVIKTLFFIWSLKEIWRAFLPLLSQGYRSHFQALSILFCRWLLCGGFLYHLAISSICFCSSCIFNSSKNSLTFGAGIPLYFFVVSLFIKLSDSLDFLKYFTFNTLYDTQKIIEGSGYAHGFVIMLVISVCLYAAGIIWFEKKDLPL